MADLYGRDLFCGYDLDPFMRETVGTETLVLAAWRRLQTPRGGNPDDPDYGFNPVSLLSQAMTPQGLSAIPGIVAAELRKDERIAAGQLSVLADYSFAKLTITIRCIGGVGPFELTVEFSKAKPKLLRSTPAIEEA